MKLFSRIFSLVLLFGLVASWAFFALPTYLGGSTEYVYVSGSSMAGTFSEGDLLISKRAEDYSVGDIVVFEVKKFGTVVHRIYSYSGNEIRTRGDNHKYVDPWIVHPQNIRGKVLYFIPGAGFIIRFLVENPLIFAGISSLLAMLSYLPWRRKRLAPELKVALQFGQKENRPNKILTAEKWALGLTSLGASGSAIMTVLVYVSGHLLSWIGLVLVVADAVTVGFTLALIRRLYDGLGVEEPVATKLALSGRLYLVDDLPKSALTAKAVGSAVELRKLAEDYRLPVLHHIEPETGKDTFLLITAKKGAFSWTPPKRSAGRGSKFWEEKDRSLKRG